MNKTELTALIQLANAPGFGPARVRALMGHFHAAAFGYHPLRKGYVELESVVKQLFDTGGLQGVLHMLTDDRPGVGAGESEFTRGACWIGPLGKLLGTEEDL